MKHPGFKAVQSGISKRQGVSMDRAGAMLAAGTRRAGAKARKKNPRLNRVKGYKTLGEHMMEGMPPKRMGM